MTPVPFYSHFSADPYFNMAFDEWMFARVLAGTSSFCLRLYSWSNGAITFGLNQSYERAMDITRLNNTPVIRRITGGRALFHDPSEFTYSLAVDVAVAYLPEAAASPRGMSQAVSQTLMKFLAAAGVESHRVRRSSQSNSRPDFFHKAPCFASLARDEIVAGGRKVVASAQRRVDHVLFQHGSIKISGVASHPAVAVSDGFPGGRADRPPVSRPFFDSMKPHFVAAFESWLNRPIAPCDLTRSEQEQLREQVLQVRKNNLSRRDIFKQK
jgi:lipoate-protein ligase A